MLGGVVEGYNVDCDCRKPKIGMFMRAVNEFNVDLSKSFAIGDKTRDLSICGENGCRGFLIDCNGENTEYVTVVNSLTDCVRIITGENL